MGKRPDLMADDEPMAAVPTADQPVTAVPDSGPPASATPPPVGYKSPPAHSRFSKGRSGNAKGRPRGSRSLKTELREVLEMKIPVTENGKKSKVSARHAMLLRLRQKALGGDQKAIEALLKLAAAMLPDEEPGNTVDETAADAAILTAYLSEHKLLPDGDQND